MIPDEKLAIERAVDLAGGFAALAKLINDRVDGEPITGVMVQMWVKRQQQAPADWILEISEALNKEVSVFDLLRDRKRRKLPSSRSAA